ncbi:division/cell wall cluster transcriptional repressor MraZ [Thermodesulfobacteriota bacterium]
MFRGHYEHNVDAKGRVSIPVRFREVISVKYDTNLMVTTLNKSLVAYPLSEWVILEEKLMTLPQFKPEVKSFMRMFVSGAVECSLDKQGRILIPPTLRKYANIDKELIFVGMLDKFEIWSKELWDAELDKSRSNFEDISESLAEFGI